MKKVIFHVIVKKRFAQKGFKKGFESVQLKGQRYRSFKEEDC